MPAVIRVVFVASPPHVPGCKWLWVLLSSFAPQQKLRAATLCSGDPSPGTLSRAQWANPHNGGAHAASTAASASIVSASQCSRELNLQNRPRNADARRKRALAPGGFCGLFQPLAVSQNQHCQPGRVDRMPRAVAAIGWPTSSREISRTTTTVPGRTKTSICIAAVCFVFVCTGLCAILSDTCSTSMGLTLAHHEPSGRQCCADKWRQFTRYSTPYWGETLSMARAALSNSWNFPPRTPIRAGDLLPRRQPAADRLRRQASARPLPLQWAQQHRPPAPAPPTQGDPGGEGG